MTRRRSSTGIVRSLFERQSRLGPVLRPESDMHFTTKLAGICIAAALAITVSASAQTFQKKSDGARPAPNMVTQGGYSSAQQKAGGNKAPAPQVLQPGRPSPRAVPQNSPTAPKGKNMAPLTADDCTDLGGSIELNKLCNSRFSCARTDQSGKTYHVCINGK
jgi:hypothetical protein